MVPAGSPTHVGNGATSVLSPVFDISRYNHPVIEYYRWFSNDLSENFKNDPWQVMIKDTAASSWQLVEKTYQSDYNWRRRIFAVNEYLPAGTTSIQVKFVASDSILSNWADKGQSLTVGGVDDFYMYDAAATPNSAVSSVPAVKAKIYPNPANNTLNIIFATPGAAYTINLYDMTGRSVYTAQTKGQGSCQINTGELAAGVYTLLVQAERSVQSQNIVVTHN